MVTHSISSDHTFHFKWSHIAFQVITHLGLIWTSQVGSPCCKNGGTYNNYSCSLCWRYFDDKVIIAYFVCYVGQRNAFCLPNYYLLACRPTEHCEEWYHDLWSLHNITQHPKVMLHSSFLTVGAPGVALAIGEYCKSSINPPLPRGLTLLPSRRGVVGLIQKPVLS